MSDVMHITCLVIAIEGDLTAPITDDRRAGKVAR